MPNWKEPYIKLIADQMGYIEKASDKDLESKTANPGDKNFTKYGKFMHLNGQPWCHSMLSWGPPQIGMPSGIIPHTGSCGAAIKEFIKQGRFHFRQGYMPQRGDLVYFESSPTRRHVGLVYKVDPSYIYTYEGNTSSSPGMVENGGAARDKAYPLTYSLIKGYGNPDWGEDEKEEENELLANLYERAEKELKMSKEQVDDRLLKILQQTSTLNTTDTYEVEGEAALRSMGIMQVKHDPLEVATLGTVGTLLKRFSEKIV